MGKLRSAKKSRGHYAAKKETNLDNQDLTSGLESVTLRTKEQSFASKTNKSVSHYSGIAFAILVLNSCFLCCSEFKC